MSIVTEIKCAKCDRKYSGVRSRCPFCGERLIGRGKRIGGAGGFGLKMMISVLVMCVLVIGAGVLLYTTPEPEAPAPDNSIDDSRNVSRPNILDDFGTDSLEGTNPVTPPPDPEPAEEEPEPEPVPVVRNLVITYNGKEKTDFTARITEKVDLKVIIVPEGVEESVEWTSSNESVFQVVALNTEGTAARVTGIGKGTATLTASAGEVKAETIVRVR